MKLPNGEYAVVDLAKLESYCLDPNHSNGSHKARVFRSALGLSQSDARELQNAILAAAVHGDAIFKGITEYGWVYVIDFEMVRAGARAWIRTAWIIDRGEIRPRLTSCYIRKGDDIDGI